MKDCVASSVKGAIIISAGFKETGEEGAKLEKEIMDIARDGNIRVVGPNCLGVMVSICFEILNISCAHITKSISYTHLPLQKSRILSAD